MKYLIIYTHFNDKSFNHAILESVEASLKKNNKDFEVLDLYAEGFDPVLSKEGYFEARKGDTSSIILKEHERIKKADVLIFVYPVWWVGMPAILKGYIDRVFSYGFAYKYSEKGIVPLLKEKKAFVINTMGAETKDVKIFLAIKAMNALLEQGILGFCGIKTIGHKYFGAVDRVDDSARKAMLLEVEKAIDKL